MSTFQEFFYDGSALKIALWVIIIAVLLTVIVLKYNRE